MNGVTVLDGAELQTLVEQKRAAMKAGKPLPARLASVLADKSVPASIRLQQLQKWKGTACQSPIEQEFFAVASLRISDLQPQFPIGPYFADFAIPPRRLVIELDGHEWHSTVEQRTRDAKRGRGLLLAGWRVVRFTGTEIRRGVHRCVDELLEIIDSLASKGGQDGSREC